MYHDSTVNSQTVTSLQAQGTNELNCVYTNWSYKLGLIHGFNITAQFWTMILHTQPELLCSATYIEIIMLIW